jgi:hypothetical protein
MRKKLVPLAAALLMSVPWIAFAADPATPQRYSIKQDRPDTGSHILRDVVSGSALPLDKPYGEPARCDGAPCSMQYPFRIDFTMRD